MHDQYLLVVGHAGEGLAQDACKQKRSVALDIYDLRDRQSRWIHPVDARGYELVAVLEIGIEGHEFELERDVIAGAAQHGPQSVARIEDGHEMSFVGDQRN